MSSHVAPEVFIVSAARTAIGNFQGQFSQFSAVELGAITITEAIKRANLNPEDVDQVIMGQVLTAGQGQNPARQAAQLASVPYEKPSFTVNMLCGSGLKAVHLAFQAIRNNDLSVVVAGGQESMTRAQHAMYARGHRYGPMSLADTALTDGLTDAFNDCHMGNTAEFLVKKYNVSRQDQDVYAANSQNKTKIAIASNYFNKEIVQVLDKKTSKPITRDEYPKPNTTVDALNLLKPVFSPGTGTVTAGNASGLNDGAASLVLCNSEQLEAKNLKPLAKIIAFAEVGTDPMEMGLGPVGAVLSVLNKTRWNKSDVDLFELNEAFAVQSILVVQQLEIDPGKVNICGGAVALGHPIGASGGRILVTLIYNLLRTGGKRGIAALCVGGGMGIACAIEIVPPSS